MNKWKSLIKNEYVFTVINKFISIMIGMLQSVLLARFLGANLRGISSYIASITSIGSIVVTFGMHQAYPHFRKKYKDEDFINDYISFITFYFGLIFLVSVMLSFVFVNDLTVKVSIIAIPLLGYSNVVQYVCLIESPNKKNAIFTTVYVLNLIYTLLLFMFCSRSFGLMITLLFFKDIVNGVINIFVIRPQIRMNKKILKMVPNFLKFGFFPMIALLMTTLNYRIDVLMLKQYSGIQMSMIGVYSIGIHLSEKIALIPDTLMGILVSRLSKGADEKEVAKVCRISFTISLLLCVGIISVGQWAIDLLYGDEYVGAYQIICITAAGSAFIGFFKLIAQYNIIQAKQIRNVLMLSVSILINVVCNAFLIPVWGINGAAIGTCLGHVICGIVFVLWFSNKTGISVRDIVFIQKSDLNKILKYFKTER